MADFEELHPDVAGFLSDRAGALDRDAAPIDADEAVHRTVTHSLEPARRWVHTPAAVASHARRRPAVAAAVIAALLIGSVGGFAAGRSSAPGKANVAARGAARDSSTPSTIVSQAFAVGGGGFAAPGIPQLTRLFLRTTAEGVALRGYLQEMDLGLQGGMPMCEAGQWCPPPECNPSTYFMAELSNDEAVSQNGSPQFPLDGPAASRGQGYHGQQEGAPVSSYMVQTSSDVLTVRGTWPDGFVDEMQPVNGWAIVAHSGSAPASALEVVLADASTVALKNIDGGYSYPARCQPPPPPPPELPPAGKEQPADADAARQSVTEAYEYVFTAGNDRNNNGTYIENADALKAPSEQVKQNFPEASDTVSVEVGEIRFLSTTEAALYFELKYDGGLLFGQQIGYAKFIDGHWKIEYGTMCMVFGWGGGVCDPPPDPARSTSAGNAPQPGTYTGPSGTASMSSAESTPTTTAPN
ncbi:MAG: hypothetical protein QOI95_3806 [Acidimicrobiaceae bacterium]